MAIYVFNLLVGYVPTGVDYALGTRYGYLKDMSQPVKYVFTQVPTDRYVRRYEQMGIAPSDMISAHFYMCGNGHVGATPHITAKEYFNNGRLAVKEYYSDRLLYTEYYTPADEGGELEDFPVRKSFRRIDGTTAFDMIRNKQGKVIYFLPNGETLTGYEFLCRFIQKLELTEEDIVIIDRPCHAEFVQPLFIYGNRAKIVTFLHSGHYAEKGEASEFLYLNFEYYYWFKFSKYIHTMIVSTERQKRELIEKLKEYECYVPNVAVVPVSGLEKLRYPAADRKPYSLVTVSRLVPRKRIDWIIRSVIKAHTENPQITLDIYGKGDEEDVLKLKQLVNENEADSYIHFMGHCDAMDDIYTQYEVYMTASQWETYGLSLMEAIGSGNAVIGLDVKYGNELFVQNEGNGYLLDFDFRQVDNEQYVDALVDSMSEKITQLFSDRNQLAAFHEKSYEIASNYLNDVIGEKWVHFLEEIIAEN